MTDKAMTEDQMVHIVRNALLVAGQEMGSEGDHWPVVNSTIHEIMRDVEDKKAKREALVHVKKHYEDMIKELIVIRNDSSEMVKSELEETITEIRALYRACFDEVRLEDQILNEDEIPNHFKRASIILSTLGDDNE